MGEFNSKLNIFICGNIRDNDSIINELFDRIPNGDGKYEKVYNSEYKFDLTLAFH